MVSDNESGLDKNRVGNSSIDKKATKMALYLEGEEKASIGIKTCLLMGYPKQRKPYPVIVTNQRKTPKQIFKITKYR